MKKVLYSIYDTKAAVYKAPFLLLSDAQACREFTDIFSQENPISMHPEDYSLIRLGRFSDADAQFDIEDKRTLLTGLEALGLRNAEQQRQGNGAEPIPENAQSRITHHDFEISAGGTD